MIPVVISTEVNRNKLYILKWSHCSDQSMPTARIRKCLQKETFHRACHWILFSQHASNDKNSVLSWLQEISPDIVSAGCICQIICTCTKYVIMKLGFSIQTCSSLPTQFKTTPTYYRYFVSLQTRTLTDGRATAKKPVEETRWLSLQSCVNRFLQQWTAHIAYFENKEMMTRMTVK